MTAKMMETLKTAGIANEWHKGDMHRLYIDLAKAGEMYYENCETANFKCARLALNRYERNNGKMWIEIESGDICTKSISESEEVISQIMELVEFLRPEETIECEDAEENVAIAEEMNPEQETVATREDNNMENLQIIKENMLYHVQNLQKSEESITLLYNAAAMNFALSGEKRVIWEGIRAQEEAMTNYCKKERERLAEIIRGEGKIIKDMSIPGFPFTCVHYEYDGEQYKIETEHGETTSIIYIEV